MNDTPLMFYVAVDPAHPNEAWASVVDEPRHKKLVAKSIAEWVRKGATIMRLNGEDAEHRLLNYLDRQNSERLFGKVQK